MKKKNRGAISIFALLSMMFFLIFIMVAYNNVMQKGKTQVETEGILVDYYKQVQSASDVIKDKASNTISISAPDEDKKKLLKEDAQMNVVKSTETGNKGKYIYSTGKVYLIQ